MKFFQSIRLIIAQTKRFKKNVKRHDGQKRVERTIMVAIGVVLSEHQGGVE